ncbi:MAG: exosortase-associated EpsI family protein [Phycisphaerae bacterium]
MMRRALRDLKAAFGQPVFVSCVVVLGLSAVGLEATVRILGLQFRKQPVPLRRPLGQLDRSKLLPEYEFVAAQALPPAVLEELGTDQYICWVLQDRRRGPRDPLRLVRIFVTYYTGDPGQVPHVPELCYLGGGYQQQGSTDLELEVPDLGPTGRRLPLRVLTFSKRSPTGKEVIVVLYLFSANGRFACDRERLRLILGNPFERYAYFSKVEVSFAHTVSGVSAEQAITAGQAGLRKLVPILVEDHWPDWSKLTAD